MKKILLAAAAAVAIFSAAPAAQADVVTTQRSGHWSAFRGTDAEGHGLCGMGIHAPTGANSHVGVMFRVFQSGMEVSIYNSQWRLSPGNRVMVFLDVGGQRFNMLGYTHQTDRTTIYFRPDVSREGGQVFWDFFRAVQASNRLNISFPDGGAQGWWVSLAGSNATSQVMRNCLYNHPDQSGNPSYRGSNHPGGNPAPSQQAPTPRRYNGPERHT